VHRLALLLAAASLFALPLHAQATRLVDPLDPAYQQLELLADLGLVEHVTLAQRPLSRAAIGQLLEQATRALAREDSASISVNRRDRAFVQQLLISLRERLDLPDSGEAGDGTTVSALRTVTLDVTQTDEPTRLVPPDNGIGAIDARLNTLLIDRQGRPLATGNDVLLETSHGIESRHVALVAVPELFAGAQPDGTRRTELRLQELQGRIVFANLALDVGREYVVWGQGRDVGLLNSNNSPPLDLIKLTGERPFRLPWVLHGLGPTRAAIFYADLGGDQNYPHPYLIGYQVNITPASQLDLGASVYTKSGGRGSPPATLTARLVDILPFIDASAYNNVIGTRGNFQFSDHYAGVNGRWRLVSVGIVPYAEVLLNDFDVRRLRSVLWEDAGHVFGVAFPRLAASGQLGGSLEYHHTGIRYYEHHQFTSGQTLHEVLTGDPLGPDAQGVYANLDQYGSPNERIGLQLVLERRSNDQYITVQEPNFGFQKVSVRPKEWQGRLLVGWQLTPARRQLGAEMQFGYERTRNFDFIEGSNRNGFLGRAMIQYRFD
jgi:capsule assembly protein Wzi